MSKVTAIILAGGIGSRMMRGETKQNIMILGQTVLERTLKAFNNSKTVTDMVIVLRAEEIESLSPRVTSIVDKPVTVVEGGHTRAYSAKKGFSAVDLHSDFVAIHDCARCLVTSDMIDKVVEVALENGAATAAASVTDTIKIVDENGMISSTLPRERIYRAQTPQVFSTDVYRRALEKTGATLESVTDDNMLVEALGIKIPCVDLGNDNIKITTSEDIALAEFILNRRERNNV